MPNLLEGYTVDFAISLASGFVLLFIGWLGRNLVNWFRSHASPYSGEWEQQIYEASDVNCKGSPIKIDTYKIKHKKSIYAGKLVVNVTGTIMRNSPSGQTDKRWNFIGYLDGDVLTIIYQSREGQKSRGCIYVKLVEDFKFKGYYLEEHKDGQIDKTPLVIKKKRD